MAVLGAGGTLSLRREAPEPELIAIDAVHYATNSVYVTDQGFWSGDQVTVTSTLGLPFNPGNGTAPCPDGYTMYAGSFWLLGPNRTHVSDDNDTFYNANDDAPFYVRTTDTTLDQTETYFIYRDQLDRISFYTTYEAALKGNAAHRVPILKVDFQSLSLSPAPIAGAIDKWLWTVQGQMSEWSLNLSAQEVDTTAIGDRFGESVKSIVTGGGSIDFLVDRKRSYDQENNEMQDSTSLMRLLLMCERGCKADAEFWMISDQPDRCSLLPGDLYYETQLLVTSVAVNTRATEFIAGSLNFVTVGEIKLQMGTN